MTTTLTSRLATSVVAWPAPLLWALTLGVTLAIVAGDVLTGADVAFTSLYFVPIAFGGWFSGRRLADVVALLATLTALLVDLSAHTQRSAYLHVWNFADQKMYKEKQTRRGVVHLLAEARGRAVSE